MLRYTQYLTESPLYHAKELDTKSKLKHELNDKSVTNLKAQYKLFAVVDAFEIWFNDKTFLVGSRYFHPENGELFSIGMLIRTRGANSYPTGPTNMEFGKQSFQVSWAEVSSDFHGTGLARRIYLSIINNVKHIVSDNEQYQGARRLWESLSRNVTVNVWDGNIGDYRRDQQGFKLKLKHIDPDSIWGSTPDFRNVLLVASK